MDQWKLLEKYGVKMSSIKNDDWILQVYKHSLKSGFPNLQGNNNENITISIAHLYCHGNENFLNQFLNTVHSYQQKCKTIFLLNMF